MVGSFLTALHIFNFKLCGKSIRENTLTWPLQNLCELSAVCNVCSVQRQCRGHRSVVMSHLPQFLSSWFPLLLTLRSSMLGELRSVIIHLQNFFIGFSPADGDLNCPHFGFFENPNGLRVGEPRNRASVD